MSDNKHQRQIQDLQTVTPADQLSPMAGRGISFNREEWEVMKGMAQVFVQSGAFPSTDNMAKVMVKMQAGRELGMQPVQAIQSMFFVHGKLGMYGQALLALMKKNGLKVKWLKTDAKGAKAEFSAEDQEPVVIEFNEEDAKRAGIFTGNYLKYPQDMYVARVVSRAAKFFPEMVGAPVETVEVLEDIAPQLPESPAATPRTAIEAPVPAKLQTPQEKKEERLAEKRAAAVGPPDEDKSMIADPRVAEILEEMGVAETDEDAKGILEMIVNQSWSVAQAQWLGNKYSIMKGRIKNDSSPAAELVDTAEAAADVFGDSPAPAESPEKPSYDVRCEQLFKMKSVDLKPILEGYGINFKGMDKEARMSAIIAHEYPESVGQGRAAKDDGTPPPQESPTEGAVVLQAEVVQDPPAPAPESNPFLAKLFKAGK